MRGALLLNGNAETAADLIAGAAPVLTSSRHTDPQVAEARRVLLITAAWDDEHDEAHVKQELNRLGLSSNYEGGFDRSIVNLSVAFEMRSVLGQTSGLAQERADLAEVRARARSLYLSHNAHLVGMVRRVHAEARKLEPEVTLARLADWERLPRGGDVESLFRFTLARELRRVLETLEGNDDRMFELSTELDDHALTAAGLAYSPGWTAARARLEARILEANTILVFGGNLDRLLDSLRFFRLGEVFAEALRRGAVIVGTSAGAMVFSERVIVYDDFAGGRAGEFQLWERGLSILRHVQLFPHCMERIQTDDADNLAYLARRFRHRACVGLNARSFLLVDLEDHTVTSYGPGDGVYVFGASGDKRRYDRGERIELDGGAASP